MLNINVFILALVCFEILKNLICISACFRHFTHRRIKSYLLGFLKRFAVLHIHFHYI